MVELIFPLILIEFGQIRPWEELFVLRLPITRKRRKTLVLGASLKINFYYLVC